MTTVSKNCVLVAGAGPVGLSVALCIARHGVPVRIIDLAEGPTTLSKALVVWRRTMQVLDPIINHEEFLAHGHEARQARIMSLDKEIATIPLTDDSHMLPSGVFIPQSSTEAALVQALAEQNLQIEWQTKLVQITPESDGVICQLETPNGPEEIRCSWLVDCEGAHSVVRHQLNLTFPGETIPRRWLLGDIEIPQKTDPHEMIMYNNPLGIVALFPISNTRWRIIADGGALAPEQPRCDPTDDDLQKILDERTNMNWTFSKCYWKSEFRVNERQIENYVHGRILLAGDSAHVHSPAGGQGMNTGMQDATNLAWKIALVQLGAAGPSLLDTYQQERHPIGATVVKTTGRLLKVGMNTNPIVQHVRNMFIHVGMSLSFIRRHMRKFLTEESVNLRGSALCGPGITKADAQPGDIFPDVPITISGRTVSASQLLRGNQSTCIVMGNIDDSQIPKKLGKPGTGVPLTITRIGEGTEITDIQPLADAVGLGQQQGVILVRPDSVIATVGTEVDIVGAYMKRLAEFI